MGTDKALLPFEGRSLLERAVETLRDAAEKVAIVGARERYAHFGVPVIEDQFQQCGPLGGIHAALGASDAELNIVISVDTPHISVGLLRYLVKRAEANPQALAAVPVADGGTQATCAVYRRQFRSIAEQQLKAGRYKIDEALKLVPMEFVQESELISAGFDAAMFANLNTPEEFSKAATRKQG